MFVRARARRESVSKEVRSTLLLVVNQVEYRASRAEMAGATSSQTCRLIIITTAIKRPQARGMFGGGCMQRAARVSTRECTCVD